MKRLLLCLVLLLPVPALAGEAILAWDLVPSVEQCGVGCGYRIYEKQAACSDTSVPFTKVPGDIAAGTSRYTRTGLQEGKTYCWAARSFNPMAESVDSNTVAKTIPFTAPDAPGNFREVGG